jgi:WD40 repeat protein
VASISSKANICSVKWNPNINHQLAFGSADHHVHYYDLRNASKPLYILQGHSKAVSYVQFVSRDELVTASTDSTLRLWNVNSNLSSILAKGKPSVSPAPKFGQEEPGFNFKTPTNTLRKRSSLFNLAGVTSSTMAPNFGSSLFTTASSMQIRQNQRMPPTMKSLADSNERHVRTYSGHTNEKNFVGLSVNSTGEFIACGSETNSVFMYYSQLSKPVITHGFGQSDGQVSILANNQYHLDRFLRIGVLRAFFSPSFTSQPRAEMYLIPLTLLVVFALNARILRCCLPPILRVALRFWK